MILRKRKLSRYFYHFRVVLLVRKQLQKNRTKREISVWTGLQCSEDVNVGDRPLTSIDFQPEASFGQTKWPRLLSKDGLGHLLHTTVSCIRGPLLVW